jgi:DnaJ-class molecular chaperone
MAQKTCSDCNGEGVIEVGTDNEQRCPTCGGRDNDEVIRTGLIGLQCAVPRRR